MTIASFGFADRFRGWTLEHTEFNSFNLLVGPSGAGKTQIIDALRAVRVAGISGTRRVNDCEWSMRFSLPDGTFLWEAKTSRAIKAMGGPGLIEADDAEPLDVPQFIREKLTSGSGEVLVDRSESDFAFRGTKLPRLKNTESALTLLRDEGALEPIHRALRRMVFSAAAEDFGYMTYNADHLRSLQDKHSTLDSLREAQDLPALVKAYVLQERFPDEFRRVVDDYIDIFGTVADVRLGPLSDLDPSVLFDAPPFAADWFTVAVKEEGHDAWVAGSRLSSGMYRTLVHLLELALAPRGAVVLIDEFENSLGVNCLPDLTTRLQSHLLELQFIITSHHPYIINNIPMASWRVVTRRGSVVTVRDAKSIPALKGESSQDRFIRLLNSREYREGVR